MKTLVLVQRQGTNGNESPYSIHAAGCRDIQRDIDTHDGFLWPNSFDTLSAVEAVTTDWTLKDIDINPCAKR